MFFHYVIVLIVLSINDLLSFQDLMLKEFGILYAFCFLALESKISISLLQF